MQRSLTKKYTLLKRFRARPFKEAKKVGTALIELYKKKVNRAWKIAFWATCILVFMIHAYRFTNPLLNHDALYNYYSSQHMVESGRWLLSLACGFSSFFNLPWLIGVISIIFIALTSVVIVDVFKLKNPVLIVIVGGLLVSFPAITDTFNFEYTADGYMIAMFLAALSVRLSVFEEGRIRRLFLSAVCICCTCAIYQAYVSFALILALSYFIVEIFDGKRSAKDCGRWIGRQILIYAAALAAYYAIWRLSLRLAHVEATTYQGVDQLGQMSLQSIKQAAVSSLVSFARFFLEWNFVEHGLTAWNLLNILFVLFACFVVIVSIYKSKVYKRGLQFVLGAIAGGAIPFAAFIWHFASSGVSYRTRML